MKNAPRFTLLAAATSSLLLAAVAQVAAQDQTPPKALLAKAKISLADAKKIALEAVPNATVKASELEEESGGLRWSLDLQTPGSKKITEVGVDAVTGKIVENKVESQKDEAAESAQHAKKP